jgi:drug/metabolite transporter (DMT)-like permease
MKQNEYQRFGATDVLMLLTVVVWGVNFSVIKISLREFSPHGFNGVRLIAASLILLLALKLSGERLAVAREDIVKILVLCILGHAVYQYLFITAISLSTASNTSLIMASSPVIIALLSSLAGQEKIHWAGWAGILIALFGLYLVVTQRAGTFSFTWQNLRGDTLILVGNICWAVYTVLLKPLLEKYSPLKLAALSLSLGTLFYLTIAAPAIVKISWKTISVGAWGGLAFSAVMAVSLCFIIWNVSLQKVGNTKTGIYSNITPLFAVLAAYFFLGERITPLQAVGAVVIFLGFYLTRSGYRLFERRNGRRAFAAGPGGE